jgi:NAD(P)-dependent dehydrogenase (short-subunit alcohol dehydrogenase family)
MGTGFMFFSLVFGLVVAYTLKFYMERNPDGIAFTSKVTNASPTAIVRMVQALAPQLIQQNPVNSFDTKLNGKLIVVTGGNGGIGYETVKDLFSRGADVVMAGRSESKLKDAADRIRAEVASEHGEFSGILQYVVADFSDMKSVAELASTLAHHFNDRKIDQLILNAAVWPDAYSVTPQNYEVAYATNALGPHLLLRSLLEYGALNPTARVIGVTGDIYITVAGTADETCTPDFVYSTPAGHAGEVAYCRSKLGYMWLFNRMHQRYPSLRMYLVHPGVIDTGLLHGNNPVPKVFLLDNKQGAQTTLICATAPEELLENGAYYHNTLGKMVLSAADPVNNKEKGDAFWEQTEAILQPFLYVAE